MQLLHPTQPLEPLNILNPNIEAIRVINKHNIINNFVLVFEPVLRMKPGMEQLRKLGVIVVVLK